jgi:hypothetical protein
MLSMLHALMQNYEKFDHHKVNQLVQEQLGLGKQPPQEQGVNETKQSESLEVRSGAHYLMLCICDVADTGTCKEEAPRGIEW